MPIRKNGTIYHYQSAFLPTEVFRFVLKMGHHKSIRRDYVKISIKMDPAPTVSDASSFITKMGETEQKYNGSKSMNGLAMILHFEYF